MTSEMLFLLVIGGILHGFTAAYSITQPVPGRGRLHVRHYDVIVRLSVNASYDRARRK